MKTYLIIWLSFILVSSCSKEEHNDGDNSGNINDVVIINGRMSDIINDDNMYSITNLKINTTISVEEWGMLSDMAYMGSLEILDMTNAKIVGVDDDDLYNDDEIPYLEFLGSKTLKEVYLPKSLKNISVGAFENCKKLEKVHFYEGLDSIAADAFSNSGLREELNFPKSLRSIGDDAFRNTKIIKIIINSDIKANSVFERCNNLTEVVVKEGCTMLEINFARCSSLTTVSLPNSLLYIGANAFNRCENLTSIALPTNLCYIGGWAFAGTAIKDINIPIRVQNLLSYTFSGCTQLESIVLPEELKQIDLGCFEGCTSLMNVDLPKEVASIGSKAFYGCSSMKNISLGDKVSKIRDYAFYGCSMLESVNFPTELIALGQSAFEGCGKLKRADLPDGLKEIQSATFKDCSELQDLTIGKSVSKIGQSAFANCLKLHVYNLPISVSEIDNYAFAYTGIKEMTVSWSNPLSIASNTFEGTNLSNATLNVPIGTYELYNSSLVWKDFGQIIEY